MTVCVPWCHADDLHRILGASVIRFERRTLQALDTIKQEDHHEDEVSCFLVALGCASTFPGW